MKNKKAKTDYIILSVTTIFVTVFAIISLSYAWYITTNTGQITSVTMSSAGLSGIQLSADASNWSAELSAGDGGDISLNEDVSFDSISTSGQVVDGALSFYSISKTGTAVAKTTLVEDALSYHTFDFYIKNDEAVLKKLTLGYNSSVTDLNFKDIAYSIRVAFVNLGNSATQEGAVLLDGTGVSVLDYVWEPNSTVRNNRTSLYHSGFLEEGKVLYKGVNMATTGLDLVDDLIVDNELTPEDEILDVTTYDPIGSGESSTVTNVAPLGITKLRVYIWVEGQDLDCTNSISGGTAEINFSFNSYNTVLDGETYVPAEKFSTPTITNPSDLTFSWSQVSTQLFENPSTETYVDSTDYILKISKDVDGTIVPIRVIQTNSLLASVSLNVKILEAFEEGTYYASVRVYSPDYADSDFSNTISFDVLGPPTDAAIITSTISWSAVTNASSYTIKAYDDTNDETYSFTTSSLTIDLSTQTFTGPSGTTTLPLGRTYRISVMTNATTGYGNSVYCDEIIWTN